MAEHRHKRVTNARKLSKAALVAGPIAAVATVATVTTGVLASGPDEASFLASQRTSLSEVVADREDEVSRDATRQDVIGMLDPKALRAAQGQYERLEKRLGAARATARAIRQADTRLWTTTELNIWSESGKQAKLLGVLDAGEKILITGRKADDRTEIVLDGKSRWVTSGYLDDEKPVFGIGGECTNGTSVESGVSANIVAVHQAVCARFAEISTYGTLRGGGGDHPLGRAVDIMVSGDRGWQVAEFVRANYAELGVSYVIYAQRIWSVERAGEGWRYMENRGSVTANHYDHVHVSTY